MMMKMLQDTNPTTYNNNILKNTSKFDTAKTKNLQVSVNLVDNAIVDWHNELDYIVDSKIDKEIPFIDLVESNNQKHDEGITCRIHIKLSTIERLKKRYEKKYGEDLGISKEIRLILEEYLNRVETHENTHSYIKYDNATPRIDVLKRLSDIGLQLKNNSTNIFSKKELLRIVERQESFKNSRTIKKYHDCLLLYSINLDQANIKSDHYNMSGFYDGVQTLIKNWENRPKLNDSHNYAQSYLKEPHSGGIGVNQSMQQVIDEAGRQPPAIHDFRIKFPSTQLHENAIKKGKEPNPRNKGIFEKKIHVTKNITTNIHIYPKSTIVELACTFTPIPYDSTGSKQLQDHIIVIHNLLRESYHVEDIPNILEWIVSYYHLNQDGTIRLSGEQFCRKISNPLGKDTIEYAKSFQDGYQRMRSENIITPNISLGNLIKNMEIQKL